MAFSDRSGVRIHYEVGGRGPALVLVHANPFDRRMWLFQQAALSEQFTVVAMDLRGYGHSEYDDTEFTLRDLMSDVVGVCDQEGITEAVFVGASVGSGICLLTALDRPDLVRALVLVGGSSGGPSRAHAIIDELLCAGREDRLDSYLWSRMQAYVAPGFAATRLGHWLLRRFLDDASNRSAAVIAQFYRARTACNLTHRLADLDLPVLVVNGEHDVSLEGGRRTAEKILRAEHAIIAETGHVCCLEDPGAFNATLTAFLQRHELWPTADGRSGSESGQDSRSSTASSSSRWRRAGDVRAVIAGTSATVPDS